MRSKKIGLSRRDFLKATAASAAAVATGVSVTSAAPAKKPSARQDEVTIQFGLYGFWAIPPEGGPGTPDEMAMQEFLDVNPNVKLEQIDVNLWDAAVLLTNIAGGTAPAYYMSGVISNWNTAGTLSSFKQGLFADITPLYQQYDIDSKLGNFARNVNRGKFETSEGEFYGLPFEIAIGNGIVYRKDLLLAAGFEEPTWQWTWEDVREMAKALTGEFTKGITMQGTGLGWFTGSEGYGWLNMFSQVPAPETSWNWRRDYESGFDVMIPAIETFRAMMYEDESILTDVTFGDQQAEDNFYNRTAAMATIPLQFITRVGVPHVQAIAEEEGMPFDDIIGVMSHPIGANGHFQTEASNQPISFSPDLSPEQLDVLVRMYDFLELGDGFDLTMRSAYEESGGNLKFAYASWPFVRAKEGIDGVDGSPRDAWGNFVDFVDFMAGLAGEPEAGAFIPAEKNQGPTEDAWNDVQSRLMYEMGNMDIESMLKEAQDVYNEQAADFESSVSDDEFIQGAAEYYAALASYWEEKFPDFYERTFKAWYETVIADALAM